MFPLNFRIFPFTKKNMIGKENTPPTMEQNPTNPTGTADPTDRMDHMERPDRPERTRGRPGHVPLHAVQGRWSNKKQARKVAVKHLQTLAGRVAHLRAHAPTDIVGQFEKEHAVRELVAVVAHALPPILAVDKIILRKCKTLLEGVALTYFPVPVHAPAHVPAPRPQFGWGA